MDPLIPRLGLALAIGLLVGLERGWRERDEPDRSRTAGIRTYGIAGLLGGVFAGLAQVMSSPGVLVAGFLGFAGVFAWFKAREAAHEQDFSVTGVFAGLVVFALGALAVAGETSAAAAGGAALAAILASREVLHGLLRRLTWIELRSALILAVMTAIILPLLPDRTIDPWQGLNPREIWFFTVLTATISFCGYAATRLIGATRGILASGLAGAVVSSTAVTVAFARLAGQGGDHRPFTGAAAFAATISILRVCIIVTLIGPSVLWTMAPPALAAAAVFAAFGIFYLRGPGDGAGAEGPRNPFELGQLLIFAGLFAVVSTASAALSSVTGEAGVLVTSAVSGTFDVDVAVLSALRLAGEVLTPEGSGYAVLAALSANAVGRLTLAVAAGPIAFSLPLIAATALAFCASAAVFVLMPG